MINKLHIASIPVSEIKTTGQMVRVGMDDDHVIELSNSIARLGLLQPIVVEEAGDHEYQLIAGAHRLAACRRLNWTHIPANIRQASHDTVVKGLALVENIIRRDMSLQEECQAVQMLEQEQNLSTSQICQLLGRGKDWVNKRLAAPNFPDKIRDALFDNMISLSIAEEISSVEDPGFQNIVLNEAIYAKRTLFEVKSMVETFKAVPSISDAVETGLAKAEEARGQGVPKKACEYNHEVVKLSDMKLLWLCGNCYNEILAIRDLAANIHTEGREEYGTVDEDTDRQHK